MNLAYFHPFADPVVIAGQGTVALEILDDAPQIETLLVAIGGGGLISGIAVAAKAINPRIRIVGVEPVGAATLYSSLKAGRPVLAAFPWKHEAIALKTSTLKGGRLMTPKETLRLAKKHEKCIIQKDEDSKAEQKRLEDHLARVASKPQFMLDRINQLAAVLKQSAQLRQSVERSTTVRQEQLDNAETELTSAQKT